MYTEREGTPLVSPLTKTLILLYQNPTLRTSFNLNYLLKGTHLQIQPRWGLPLHMNLGEIHLVQAISLTVKAMSRN